MRPSQDNASQYIGSARLSTPERSAKVKKTKGCKSAEPSRVEQNAAAGKLIQAEPSRAKKSIRLASLSVMFFVKNLIIT